MVARPPKLIQMDRHADDRGGLIVGQMTDHWDFEVKRIYFVQDFEEGTLRGAHAHKQLQQVMIAISGAVEVTTDDGADGHHTWVLDNPQNALRLYPPVWREIKSLSEDAVFLVLASAPYDAEDYINDYEAFVAYVAEEANR